VMRTKMILLTTVALTVTACASLTPAEKAERIRQVQTALNDRHYLVDVKEMYPRRGPSRNIASDWSLEVRGDTLVSYLPYFGRAYSIPYLGGKGLNFTAPISKYSDYVTAKGVRVISLVVDNGEDVISYQLEVFDNGQTTIAVQPHEMESISYGGELSWPQ